MTCPNTPIPRIVPAHIFYYLRSILSSREPGDRTEPPGALLLLKGGIAPKGVAVKVLGGGTPL